MNNKKNIYSLKNEGKRRHIAEYFQIIKCNEKYLLYYNSENKIKLVASTSLVFMNKKPIVIIENAPGGCFCIINKDNCLYMLCGCHNSNKGPNEIAIPDLVWPKNKRTILDWKKPRTDRKNGMYLLKSKDGIHWEQISTEPVLHSYIKSPTCKLGECCFDTHPCLIKWKNEYIFFGRLNSSLDERRVYIRKSKNLIDWSLPERINITNENNNNQKKNYYNFVVFENNDLLYAFTPHFEACGTEARKCKNGCTLLLKSNDGINWEIIHSYLPHTGKYKDRVNSVLIEKGVTNVFFRENCLLNNQNLIMFNFKIKTKYNLITVIYN